MEIGLYGSRVAVTRLADVADPDWARIGPRLESLNGLDRRLQQPPILALTPTLLLIGRISVFRSVQFGRHRMTRSFVDTANGHFYWHASDLADAGYATPERILSYWLHDAHHCRQHLDGDRAQDLDSLVRREVDATDVQLVMARVASAGDSRFIDFLVNYRNNRKAIEDRLKTGVGMIESMLFGAPRYQSHLAVF